MRDCLKFTIARVYDLRMKKVSAGAYPELIPVSLHLHFKTSEDVT